MGNSVHIHIYEAAIDGSGVFGESGVCLPGIAAGEPGGDAAF
jgi:hypothetical protein